MDPNNNLPPQPVTPPVPQPTTPPVPAPVSPTPIQPVTPMPEPAPAPTTPVEPAPEQPVPPAPEPSAPTETPKPKVKKGISASLPIIIVVAGILVAVGIISFAVFMSK